MEHAHTLFHSNEADMHAVNKHMHINKLAVLHTNTHSQHTNNNTHHPTQTTHNNTHTPTPPPPHTHSHSHPTVWSLYSHPPQQVNRPQRHPPLGHSDWL